jgi:hypothetical protein
MTPEEDATTEQVSSEMGVWRKAQTMGTKTLAGVATIRTNEKNRPDGHIKQIPIANCTPTKKGGQHPNTAENRTRAAS